MAQAKTKRYPFVRRGGALLPASAEAEDALRAVRHGREVMLAFRPARNIRHHKLLFAMLKFVVEHTDQFPSKDVALIALKIACGLVDPFIDASSGKTYFVPRSISFEAMAQDEFSAFFDRATFVIAERWMPPGTTPEVVRAEILAMIDPMHAPSIAPHNEPPADRTDEQALAGVGRGREGSA